MEDSVTITVEHLRRAVEIVDAYLEHPGPDQALIENIAMALAVTSWRPPEQ